MNILTEMYVLAVFTSSDVPIKIAPSVHLYEWNNSRTDKPILIKFGIG
jgi:hypothetical protein